MICWRSWFNVWFNSTNHNTMCVYSLFLGVFLVGVAYVTGHIGLSSCCVVSGVDNYLASNGQVYILYTCSRRLWLLQFAIVVFVFILLYWLLCTRVFHESYSGLFIGHSSLEGFYEIWVTQRSWDGQEALSMCLFYVGIWVLVCGGALLVPHMLYGSTVVPFLLELGPSYESFSSSWLSFYRCAGFLGVSIVFFIVSSALCGTQWMCGRWGGRLLGVMFVSLVFVVLSGVIWGLGSMGMDLGVMDWVHTGVVLGLPGGYAWKFMTMSCLYVLCEGLLGLSVLYVCSCHYTKLYQLYDRLAQSAHVYGWNHVLANPTVRTILLHSTLPDFLSCTVLGLAFVGRVGYSVASFVWGWVGCWRSWLNVWFNLTNHNTMCVYALFLGVFLVGVAYVTGHIGLSSCCVVSGVDTYLASNGQVYILYTCSRRLWILQFAIVVFVFILLYCLLCTRVFHESYSVLFIGHSSLEGLWTLVPSVLLFTCMYNSLVLLYDLEGMCYGYDWVNVTGNQWFWKYELDGDVFSSYLVNDALSGFVSGSLRLLQTDDYLTLKPYLHYNIMLSSEDVIHSFAVPNLGIKLDAVPGRLNQLGFRSFICGSFYGQCSEICGSRHAFMPILLNFSLSG